jgi:hypothetical protein
VADFTSDGILDKISSNSHEVLVRPGRGDGTFGDSIRTSIQMTPGAPLLAVADFNGDNRLDVFTAAAIDFESPPTVNVLLGRGDGGFVLAESFSIGTVPTMIGTGEIFGAGRTDVAITGYDYLSGEHGVLALFNDGHWPALVPALRGDFNGDRAVDGADFLDWQRGESPNSGSASDLSDWQANFGQTPPIVGEAGMVAAAPALLTAVGRPEQRGNIEPQGTNTRDGALAVLDSRLAQFVPQGKARVTRRESISTTGSGMEARMDDLLLDRSSAARFDQKPSKRALNSRSINDSPEEAVETRREALDIAFTTLEQCRMAVRR